MWGQYLELSPRIPCVMMVTWCPSRAVSLLLLWSPDVDWLQADDQHRRAGRDA